ILLSDADLGAAHAFPTRRSSELPATRRDRVRALVTEMRRRELPIGTVAAVLAEVVRGRAQDAGVFAGLRRPRHLELGLARLRPRSEEHTSELQSLAYLVCRLLLE